jgi:hypothetical protein
MCAYPPDRGLRVFHTRRQESRVRNQPPVPVVSLPAEQVFGDAAT